METNHIIIELKQEGKMGHLAGTVVGPPTLAFGLGCNKGVEDGALRQAPSPAPILLGFLCPLPCALSFSLSFSEISK